MITSTANRQIKAVIQLKKKAKERSARDLFLVEGPKMFLEAPPERICKAYLSDAFYQRHHKDPALANLLERIDFDVLSDPVFAAVSDTRTPQGVICLVRQYHYGMEALLGHDQGDEAKARGQAAGKPFLLALERLQDPGNLGTIFRTAEGAGVTGILMSRDTADLYNPKVIRSTMGSIYRMPFCYTENLKETLREWKQAGISLFAAHLQGELSYDREDYRGPSAFLIGNESRGLTGETAALADRYIRIPMLGQVESLNAAVAASVLMFEAARQRRER